MSPISPYPLFITLPASHPAIGLTLIGRTLNRLDKWHLQKSRS